MNIASELMSTMVSVLGQAVNMPPELYRTIGIGIGAGLACLGAGWGIGRIASASVESIARQPEASGDIRGAMILTSAFIEGVCLFGVVTALLGYILK